MLEKERARKLIIAGVAVTVLAAGGYGTYKYMNPKQAPTASHSSHQTGAPSAIVGDKVTLDAKARQLAGVQTAKVEKKALTKNIRTTGKVAVNETGKAYLTSRIMGRIDELYVNADGAYVAPGQALAAVYSTDYIAAQEEYILALETVQKLKNISPEMNQTNAKLLQAARRKLDLLGVSSGEIEHLEHTRQSNRQMIIRAQFGGTVTEKLAVAGAYVMAGEKLFGVTDLSTVWLYADVYERDIASIQLGQEVAVTTPAYPGQTFSGMISFISPIIDDATRTTKVRVELSNPDGKLKPNMFASAAIKSSLNESLVIPTSSLIDTGLRKIVFIAQDESTFVKRDVVIGQESNGFIQVLSGLNSGDVVVTKAAFLIDSQTQLGAYGSHAGHGSGKSGGGTPQQTVPANAPQSAPPAQTNVNSGHSGH
ncbi:efflux transporter periplasmic adaptor subunit [Anaerosporomusa subterranea]|uniref:Efflux transporter periplasmic adaptor subunit n=1 Tax=Anaerosporomusa subterranea TaxID=1794912 RepID=A0A154BLN8_ANASB|nr:efflux RND transporter periplasmic adaptor subunit [Anaerosporomusa subterranea]KYZ74893.1 efflux transporter periplasmic adaptor subunit [Anaerosporomusa subterranea]